MKESSAQFFHYQLIDIVTVTDLSYSGITVKQLLGLHPENADIVLAGNQVRKYLIA